VGWVYALIAASVCEQHCGTRGVALGILTVAGIPLVCFTFGAAVIVLRKRSG
jgi:hypothetical protein